MQSKSLRCLSLLPSLLLAGCQEDLRVVGWGDALEYAPDEMQPITIGRYGYPYLTIEINEQPIEVFLDTGNMSGLFLSTSTIRTLELAVDHETTRRDSQGRSVGQAKVYLAEHVAALSDSWTDRLVIERDVPGARGAIGPAYLLGKRFTIDYANRTLAVSESSLSTIPLDGVTLEMRPVTGLEGMIVVPGMIHGEEVLIQIDTGKSRGCIDPDLAARLELKKTLNGFRIDELQLGSLTFEVPSARGVRFRGISHDLEKPIEFGLGSDILKDLVMTVDYERGVVILQRH
jgi:hypothetical protein